MTGLVSRAACRYAAFFCEENIWWLAHSLVGEGVAPGSMEVWLFSNAQEQILVGEQRSVAPGEWMVWDYHVVLWVGGEGVDKVFDFDTRLQFPVDVESYLQQTFPQQSLLPQAYRALVRRIPAGDYLARFSSDRSHMIGELPQNEFPDWPAISVAPGSDAVTLAAYRDMRNDSIVGAPVQSVESLMSEISQA